MFHSFKPKQQVPVGEIYGNCFTGMDKIDHACRNMQTYKVIVKKEKSV